MATLWSGAAASGAVVGADPVLDDEALASYRKRFEEIEVAIALREAR